MAFRQPQQRPQFLRHASLSQPVAVAPETAAQAAVQRRRLEEREDESQEWVLFSPTIDEQLSTTSCTSQTPRTANLSRASEIDSLETGLRSDRYAIDENDESLTCQGTENEDDGEDLDSLDDGLHAFQGPLSPRLDHSGGTVLPTHDGLGTFPSSYAIPGAEDMQDHLWQFERYNPHRRRPQQRRRSSLQRRMEMLENEEETQAMDKHEERRLRIEKWRLEQSRAVLEEIERETRRRQRRMSIISAQSGAVPRATDETLQDMASASKLEPKSATTGARHREAHAESEPEPEFETFWQRITRRVIKDLMGLDESTLSVIFGEDLAPELDDARTTSSTLPPSATPSTMLPLSDMTWEQRLLERIARELGMLAHKLSEHEGAFSTYKGDSTPMQTQDTSRVGLPTHTRSSETGTSLPLDEASVNDHLFAPTLPKATISPHADTCLWGIEEEPPLPTNAASASAAEKLQRDNEYWERDLDVGVIFRYLRNRFSPQLATPSPSPAPAQTQSRDIPTGASSGPLPPTWASDQTASAFGTSPESFRRADMLRRHHPLVSHAATISATRRRESMLLRRQHQLLMHRRAGSSSCASQSTKRTRSGGSRRYWDFPNGAGSATGGSAVSVTSGGYEGMMGSWGEV